MARLVVSAIEQVSSILSRFSFPPKFAVWNQPALLRVGALITLLRDNPPPKLPVPVEQVAPKELADTWGALRGDNRRHEGIDIFASLGRPVISTTHGVVLKVGEDNLGGHVVRVLGPGWQWHHYAHLDRFGDVEPGSIVQPWLVRDATQPQRNSSLV